jgi:hypothetical protein
MIKESAVTDKLLLRDKILELGQGFSIRTRYLNWAKFPQLGQSVLN